MADDEADRQRLTTGLGFVSTGVIAFVLIGISLPGAYAVAVALGIGLSISNYNGPRGDSFDRTSYVADRGRNGRLFDVVAATLAAVALGAGSTFLLFGREPSGAIPFAVGAFGALVGVYGVFIVRNGRYFQGPQPD